ncbi:MAG: DUF2523 domain-containing protein [Alysiella sp.]|uniref:DUF2523 domain-containing protein n=1 Tax=Alysiella sp. TaxID=1872483 RepID=UPI0026DD6853|nr:DUF2523 domain-containing protein [Alysiella sp.]MDO4433721.1 DUF2523 domain-containing protein [Alysiella sp.]
MKFLAALIPSLLNGLKTLIGQVLIALGITAVTYKGLEHVVSGFKTQITANINILPNELLQLFYIAGGGVALNILLGAFTFYISLQGMTKITSRIGKKT